MCKLVWGFLPQSCVQTFGYQLALLCVCVHVVAPAYSCCTVLWLSLCSSSQSTCLSQMSISHGTAGFWPASSLTCLASLACVCVSLVLCCFHLVLFEDWSAVFACCFLYLGVYAFLVLVRTWYLPALTWYLTVTLRRTVLCVLCCPTLLSLCMFSHHHRLCEP